jgi:hypothetical protein
MQQHPVASDPALLTKVLLTPCRATNWEVSLDWESVRHRRKEALNAEALRSCGLVGSPMEVMNPLTIMAQPLTSLKTVPSMSQRMPCSKHPIGRSVQIPHHKTSTPVR